MGRPKLLIRPVRLIVIELRRTAEVVEIERRRRSPTIGGLVGEGSGIALPGP